MDTFLVQNKRTKREEIWTQEDIDNAKKAKMMDRFTIVRKTEDKKTSPPNEVLGFLVKEELKKVTEAKEETDRVESTEEKPKPKPKQKKPINPANNG